MIHQPVVPGPVDESRSLHRHRYPFYARQQNASRVLAIV